MTTKSIDALKTGILQIDQEHHDMYTIIIQLYLALEHDKDQGFYLPLIKKLVELMVVHFYNEETSFNQYDYREADMHMREHIKIRMQVAQFYDSYTKGLKNITKEAIYGFSTMFLNHIECFDMEYVPCLKAGKKRYLATAI
jgi:hemerythrin-like metal-binding protein